MLGFFQQHESLLRCPRCEGALHFDDDAGIDCRSCARHFGTDTGIPLLFWPNEWDDSRGDVTQEVQRFYEATPFPNYDDFDGVASLVEKAQRGLFAKVLDRCLPLRSRVLEVGCGTGQMSNFLSVAERTVVGADMCLNSLRLAQSFARSNRLRRVHFVQMNLFRPIFAPGSFGVVISNGVLHHTSDPPLAFRSIARLVRPGGHVLVGLYHRYGRLITDARRFIFRAAGDRFRFLDPNLRKASSSEAKRTAWFMDQYKHPHESKHTIRETIGWLNEAGFDFVRSIPSMQPFRRFTEDVPLFEAESPGNALEGLLAEAATMIGASEQGGFFIVIGRRRLTAPIGQFDPPRASAGQAGATIS
jgi:SAM-dependent methyltransferase